MLAVALGHLIMPFAAPRLVDVRMMASSADGTIKKPDFVAAVAAKADVSKAEAEKVRERSYAAVTVCSSMWQILCLARRSYHHRRRRCRCCYPTLRLLPPPPLPPLP